MWQINFNAKFGRMQDKPATRLGGGVLITALTILLIITTVKYIALKVWAKSLVKYMEESGYKVPNNKDLEKIAARMMDDSTKK